MRDPTLPRRDPMYSLAYHNAQDSSEHVQIVRYLERGNMPVPEEESWDPIVNVFFKDALDTELHPDDEPGIVGDGWQNIRWSVVNRLIEALLDARAAAVRTGMLPRPMSDSERMARCDQVRKGTGKPAVWGPKAVRTMRRIEQRQAAKRKEG